MRKDDWKVQDKCPECKSASRFDGVCINLYCILYMKDQNAKDQNMNKILITGAAGFVGANLCKYFLQKGDWHVHAIVNPKKVEAESDRLWRLNDIHEDLFENLSIETIDMEFVYDKRSFFKNTEIDVIINAAAYGSYACQNGFIKMQSMNQEAVQVMLDTLWEENETVKFIQLGTSSEYGWRCQNAKETTRCAPNSEYAVTKLAATNICELYRRTRNMDITTFRLGSVFGPYEDPSRFMMTLARHVAEKKLPPFSNPSTTRDFIYVEYLCRIIYKAIVRDLRPGVYNVSSGKYSFKDLIKYIKKSQLIHEEPNWDAIPAKKWEIRNWSMDCTKLRCAFDDSEISSLLSEEAVLHGFANTLEWVKDQSDLLKIADEQSVVKR